MQQHLDLHLQPLGFDWALTWEDNVTEANLHVQLVDSDITVTWEENAARADLHVQPFDCYRVLLAHSPGSADGLLLQGWVHSRLQQEDMAGCSQVDAHSPCLD